MDDQVVGINHSPLFDEISHTQGGVPHLLQHLWNAYCSYLDEKLQERKAKNLPSVGSLQVAKNKAPATHFIKWASDYLQANRVVENFFIDENHGVRLSNNTLLAVCPGTTVQGTMQESGAVQVTEGRSQRDMEGVVPTPNIRI